MLLIIGAGGSCTSEEGIVNENTCSSKSGYGSFQISKRTARRINQKKHHDVYLSLPNDEYVPELVKKIGCKFVKKTHVDRRGTNPMKDLKLLFRYIHMMRRIKPDVVLTYTIKPNVYGGIACWITKKISI